MMASSENMLHWVEILKIILSLNQKTGTTSEYRDSSALSCENTAIIQEVNI